MTPEQEEILLNANKAFLNGEIDREQYQDVRNLIASEILTADLSLSAIIME